MRSDGNWGYCGGGCECQLFVPVVAAPPAAEDAQETGSAVPAERPGGCLVLAFPCRGLRAMNG